MIKIVTIIGARPQFIKAAAISRTIRTHCTGKLKEIIVHTGQHYDENMSEVFFNELSIPRPDYNLNVGSSSHGEQTAHMIKGIEQILLKEKPAFVILYGDTNSTIAGAVAASKIHIPIAHIEAGLRSFNKSMPEEINRITCDHASTLLFSPTKTGYNNLLKEGFNPNNNPPFNIDNPKIYHCGDVMLDNSLFFADIAEKNSNILTEQNIEKNNYILATIHRPNNTDVPERFNAIFNAIQNISIKKNIDFIIPLHPRTAHILKSTLDEETYQKIARNERIKICKPVSFLDMIMLEKHAKIIMTDSGGVQKEAFFFEKPSLILRPETEWKEVVELGTALICDADQTKIEEGFDHFEDKSSLNFDNIFGDGKASEFICKQIFKTANQ